MASAVGLALRKPHLLFRRVHREEEGTAESKQSSLGSNSSPQLCTYDELPLWYQDNPYIRTSYRPVSDSYQSCLHSLTYLHNETINIYTHFIPAVVLAFALPTLQIEISWAYATAPLTDRFMLTLTPMATLLTLTLSTTYHTLMNHSHFISASCLLLDYTGILALILSSFITGIYVGFYHSPFHRYLYWGMILSLVFISAILVLHPRLQGPKWRSIRTAAFILTALSGFAPVIHGLLKYGWQEMVARSGMPYWFAEGAWYGLGAFFFASRVPESCVTKPYSSSKGEDERKYKDRRWNVDLFGSSHQIFHVCVLFGAACHCWGVFSAWRATVQGSWAA